MTLGELIASLGVDTTGLDTATQSIKQFAAGAAQQLNAIATAAGNTSTQLNSLGQALTHLSKQAATATKIISSASKQFDSSNKSIKATEQTTNKAAIGMEKVGKAAEASAAKITKAGAATQKYVWHMVEGNKVLSRAELVAKDAIIQVDKATQQVAAHAAQASKSVVLSGSAISQTYKKVSQSAISTSTTLKGVTTESQSITGTLSKGFADKLGQQMNKVTSHVSNVRKSFGGISQSVGQMVGQANAKLSTFAKSANVLPSLVERIKTTSASLGKVFVDIGKSVTNFGKQANLTGIQTEQRMNLTSRAISQLILPFKKISEVANLPTVSGKSVQLLDAMARPINVLGQVAETSSKRIVQLGEVTGKSGQLLNQFNRPVSALGETLGGVSKQIVVTGQAVGKSGTLFDTLGRKLEAVWRPVGKVVSLFSAADVKLGAFNKSILLASQKVEQVSQSTGKSGKLMDAYGKDLEKVYQPISKAVQLFDPFNRKIEAAGTVAAKSATNFNLAAKAVDQLAFPFGATANAAAQMRLPFEAVSQQALNMGNSLKTVAQTTNQMLLPFKSLAQATAQLSLPFHGITKNATQLSLPLQNVVSNVNRATVAFDNAGRAISQMSLPFSAASKSAMQLSLPFERISAFSKLWQNASAVFKSASQGIGTAFQTASKAISKAGTNLTADIGNAYKRTATFFGITKKAAIDMSAASHPITSASKGFVSFGNAIDQAGKKTAKAANDVTSGTRKVTGAAQNLMHGHTSFFEFVKGVATGMLAYRAILGVMSAITGAISGTIRIAIDFQAAMADVAKVLNKPASQLDNLAKKFRELSKTIPLSVLELAKIGQTAAQLGIAEENIAGFVKSVANLAATAENLSIEEASNQMARFAVVTQMDQREFENLASTILALGSEFNATEKDILHFTRYTAAAGKQAGMTEAQILAWSTAIASVGPRAQAGGTAFSRILIDMTKEVATTGKKLEWFTKVAGIDFKKAFKEDASNAFQKFIEGLSNLEKSEAIVILNRLGYEGARDLDVFLLLAGAGKTLANALKLAVPEWEKHTRLGAAAAERYKALDKRIILLKSALLDLGITIGEIVIPKLERMVGSLTNVANAIGEGLPQKLTSLQAALVTFTGVLVGGAILKWTVGFKTLGEIAKTLPALFGARKLFEFRNALNSIAITAGITAKALGLMAKASIVGGAIYVAYEWAKILDGLAQIGRAAQQQKKSLQDLREENDKLVESLKKLGAINIPERRPGNVQTPEDIAKFRSTDLELMGPAVGALFNKLFRPKVGDYRPDRQREIDAEIAYADALGKVAKAFLPAIDGAGKLANKMSILSTWYDALGDEQKQLADKMLQAAMPANMLAKEINELLNIGAPQEYVMAAYAYDLLEAADRQKKLGIAIDETTQYALNQARTFAKLHPSDEILAWIREVRELHPYAGISEGLRDYESMAGYTGKELERRKEIASIIRGYDKELKRYAEMSDKELISLGISADFREKMLRNLKIAKESSEGILQANKEIAEVQKDMAITTGKEYFERQQEGLKRNTELWRDRAKVYVDTLEAIAKATTKDTLEQLRLRQEMVDTMIPLNEMERRKMDVEKVHLEFALRMEEARVKYAQARADIESKIANLPALPPGEADWMRERLIAELEKLHFALGKELAELGTLEALNVLKVQREHYLRMINTVREGAGEVFDAIASRGKNAFGNLLDWIEAVFLSRLRMLFQNFTELLFTPGTQGQGGQKWFERLFENVLPRFISAPGTNALAPMVEQKGAMPVIHATGLDDALSEVLGGMAMSQSMVSLGKASKDASDGISKLAEEMNGDGLGSAAWSATEALQTLSNTMGGEGWLQSMLGVKPEHVQNIKNLSNSLLNDIVALPSKVVDFLRVKNPYENMDMSKVTKQQALQMMENPEWKNWFNSKLMDYGGMSGSIKKLLQTNFSNLPETVKKALFKVQEMHPRASEIAKETTFIPWDEWLQGGAFKAGLPTSKKPADVGGMFKPKTKDIVFTNPPSAWFNSTKDWATGIANVDNQVDQIADILIHEVNHAFQFRRPPRLPLTLDSEVHRKFASLIEFKAENAERAFVNRLRSSKGTPGTGPVGIGAATLVGSSALGSSAFSQTQTSDFANSMQSIGTGKDVFAFTNLGKSINGLTQVTKSFDAEGIGYDIVSAIKARLNVNETGHFPSRVPDTGLLLKGRQHETWFKTEAAEKALGYEITKIGNRYFSFLKPQETANAFQQVTKTSERFNAAIVDSAQILPNFTMELTSGADAWEKVGLVGMSIPRLFNNLEGSVTDVVKEFQTFSLEQFTPTISTPYQTVPGVPGGMMPISAEMMKPLDLWSMLPANTLNDVPYNEKLPEVGKYSVLPLEVMNDLPKFKDWSQKGIFGITSLISKPGEGGFFQSGGGINGKGVGGVGGGLMAMGGMMSLMDSFKQTGIRGWGEAVGGGAALGGSLAGPWGALAGAVAGAITRGIKLALGKSAYLAGSMEAMRDFGVKLGEDQFKGWLESLNITEERAYDIRKELESSPKALVELLAPIAEANGQMETFLKKLQSVNYVDVSGKIATVNLANAFKLGQITGDFTELNRVWTETIGTSKQLNQILPDFAQKLAAAGDAAQSEIEKEINTFAELRKAILAQVEANNDITKSFLEEGIITEEFRARIVELGGDIAKFEAMSNMIKVKNDFEELTQNFWDTGEVLPELITLFEQFGFTVADLDQAFELGNLQKSLNFINDLKSSFEGLTDAFDPIKQLMSGKMDPEVIEALTKAGLDPDKFRKMLPLLEMEQGWDSAVSDFFNGVKNVWNESTGKWGQAQIGLIKGGAVEKGLLAYGGTAGIAAVERYYRGFNTITEDLLQNVKMAMDQAYQAEIKTTLEYLNQAQQDTTSAIDSLKIAVEAKFETVRSAIVDTLNATMLDVVDALDDILEKMIELTTPVTGVEVGSGIPEPPPWSWDNGGSPPPPVSTEPDFDQWQWINQILDPIVPTRPVITPELFETLPSPPRLSGTEVSLDDYRVPKLDKGGWIKKTGLAIVDRGEAYSGVGGTPFGPTIVINNLTAYGWDDFVDKIRKAGVSLVRRGNQTKSRKGK